jgi:hypothetical protein
MFSSLLRSSAVNTLVHVMYNIDRGRRHLTTSQGSLKISAFSPALLKNAELVTDLQCIPPSGMGEVLLA